MKKLLTITAILLLTSLVYGQAPQALNYQAVARTADGVIIPTQNISVRFSILDVSVTGTTLYSETHTVTTNSYGLFTLAIGRGTPVTSTFSNINWASGTDKFLKVEIAPAGGSNYQLQGTTQLLSVPYALYSEKTRLLAGNNTISITNGNTITGNYQAGTGINIAGNTISHNFVAGTGIGINGNVISNTATNQWLPHANGIYYPASGSLGNVAIRTTPTPQIAFISNGSVPGVIEGNAALFTSNSTWHTNVVWLDSTLGINNRYSFALGGSGNTEGGPGNFGIFNHNIPRYALLIDRTTNNIGVGMTNIANTEKPKSKFHVFNGDVNIDQIGSGIILKSPNGQCWRVTIDNTGNLVSSAITCPN